MKKNCAILATVILCHTWAYGYVINFDLNQSNSIVLDGNDWKLNIVGCFQTADCVSKDDIQFTAENYSDTGWKTVEVPRAVESDINNIEQERSAQKTVVGWYRKDFQVPQQFVGSRLFLKFMGVSRSCEIWVNGKPATSHIGMYDAFDVEITDLVKSGGNLLAIRFVYPMGSQIFKFLGSQDVGHSQTGIGVWASVYMVSVPKEFVRTCLITPDLTKQTVTAQIDCDVQGNAKVTAAIVDPCTGKQLGQVQSAALNLGSKTLSLKFDGKSLRPWTIEKPKLYKLQVCINENPQQSFMFGYRSFGISGSRFMINKEPIYLKAMLLWSGTVSYGRSDKKVKQISESYLKLFKKKNLNIVRTAHSAPSEQLAFTADEMGYLLFIDFGNQVTDPNLLPQVGDEIKRIAAQFYNHPSLVMYSLGNEVWQTSFIEPQNMIYEAVRKVDAVRPITPVSGGHSFPDMPEKPYMQIDFFDIHNYAGHMDRPWNYLQDSVIKINIGNIVQKYGVLDKPLWLGECVGTSWPLAPTKSRSDEPISPKRYVEICESGLAPTWATEVGTWKYFWPISKTGGPGESNRWITGEMVKLCAEQLREIPAKVQGFCLWADNFHPAAEKIAFCDVLASNWKINRNYFAPDIIEDSLVISNTRSQAFENGSLVYQLLTDDGKPVDSNSAVLPLIPAISAIDVPVKLVIADSLETGFYKLKLVVIDSNRKQISENQYKIYVANEKTFAAKAKQISKLYLIYDVDGALANTLKLRNIDFENTGGKMPADGTVGIISAGGNTLPDGAFDPNGLKAWIEKGGKLLVDRLAIGQTCPGMSGFKCIKGRPMANIEIVSPGHPIWDGLSEDNFFFWNAPMGDLVSNALYPLTANVLAGKGFDQNNSMALSEFKIGQGGILVNQTYAAELCQADSSASRFLLNMLAYLSSDQAFVKAEQPIGAFELEDFKVDPTKVAFINLSHVANVTFSDDRGDDKKGGWPDQGSLNLGAMKPGIQVLGGVPFKVLNETQGNTAVALYGYQRQYYPLESGKIEVGKKLKDLYFLHTSAWCNREYVGGREIAIYDVIYEDGLLEHISIVGLRDIGEWWNAADLKNAVVGWSAKHPNAADMTIGMYVMKWANPRPDKQILSINLRAQKASTSIVVAGITGVSIE